jgi:O-antigen/teichoic acid export membrane protein
MTSTSTYDFNTVHLRGFALLVVGQALARAMTFVAVTYLARTLGVEMFGMIGFAAAVAVYFLLVVDAGLDLIAMREVAKQESSAESVIASVFALRLGLAVVAMALLAAVVPWLASSSTGLMVMLAYSLTFLSAASNLKWGFQALEQNGLVAVALVLSQAVYLGGVLLWINGPGDALKVPLLLFGSELTGAALLFVQYRRQGVRLWLPRSRRLSWALLKEAFPLAGTYAVRTLTVNFDLVLLGLVDNPLAVGLYSAVSRVIMLLREFGGLYYLALFPALSRAAKETTDRFVMLGQVVIRHAAALIFPLVVGAFLTGPELLSFVFGSEYVPGAYAFCLLLGAVAFNMLVGVYRFGLVAYNRQPTLFRIMSVGAAVNVGMNLVLIPHYSLVGGAFSAVVSEAVVFVLAWLAVAQSVALSPWKPVVRPALATAGMAVILWLLPTLPFPMTVIIAAASYVIFVFVSGAVHLSELTEAWHPRPRLNAGEISTSYKASPDLH